MPSIDKIYAALISLEKQYLFVKLKERGGANMFKKYICLTLCLIMTLCTMSTTVSAVSLPVGDLAASAVTFKNGATVITDLPTSASTISATVTISNINPSAVSPSNAVFWVGKYVDDVLEAVVYDRVTLAAGASQNVTVNMSGVQKLTGTKTVGATTVTYDRVVLKAYVWTGFENAKALTAPACIPSTDDSVFVVKNDKIWPNFDYSAETLEYDVKFERAEEISMRLVAKDNKTDIVQPNTYVLGENAVTVTAPNAAPKNYTFDISYKAPVIKDLRYGGNTKPEEAAPVYDENKPLAYRVSPYYSDSNDNRNGVCPAYIGTGLRGLEQISTLSGLASYVTGKLLAKVGETYISFKASGGVTIYVLINQAPASGTGYTSENGWTTLNNGTTPNYGGYASWSAYLNANPVGAVGATPKRTEGENLVDVPYYMASYNAYSTTASGRFLNEELAPLSAPNQKYIQAWKEYNYCYSKHFNANEEVIIPTIGKAAEQYVIVLAKWDAPNIDKDDAELHSMSAVIGDGTLIPKKVVSVDTFTSGDADNSAYEVTVPYTEGLTKASLEAAPKFEGTTYTLAAGEGYTFTDQKEVEFDENREAVIVVTTTSLDGTQHKTYTVTIKHDVSNDKKPNKIYDITASADTASIYGLNQGYADDLAAYTIDESPYAVQDTIVSGTTFPYSDSTEYTINTGTVFAGKTTSIIRRPNAHEENTPKRVPIGDLSALTSYFNKYYTGTQTWLSFKVSSGATIYYVDREGKAWPNGVAAGWTLCDTQIGGMNAYKKHYNPGQTVEIPNYGRPAEWSTLDPTNVSDMESAVINDTGFYLVEWDSADGIASTDASLAFVKVNGIDVQEFIEHPEWSTYMHNVDCDVATVTVTVAANHIGATVTMVPADGVVELDYDETIDVRVTIQPQDSTVDQTTKTISITRAEPSDNAKLSSFTYSIDGGSATVVNGWALAHKGRRAYTVEVPHDAVEITLNGVVADTGKATIEYTPADAKLTLSDLVRKGTIKATVKSQAAIMGYGSEDKSEFTVTFITPTILKSLTYGGIGVAGFDPNTFEYDIILSSEEVFTIVGVAQTAEDGVTVAYPDGDSFDPVATGGNGSRRIEIKKGDSVLKTYTLNFITGVEDGGEDWQ